jgi:hypothetical protein
MPVGGRQGKSWNVYNAATSKWEHLSVNGGGISKFEDEFRDGAMRYVGVGVNTKMTFTSMPDGRLRQVWEQSPDGGKTWAVIFDGIYKPRRKQV